MVALHTLGLIISFIIVLLLFFEKPSLQQKILLMGFIFGFVDYLGYYFELHATEYEAVVIAVKIQYLGTTFCLVCCLFFTFLYNNSTNIILEYIIKIFYLVNNIFVCLTVFTFDKHSLFYTNIEPYIYKGHTFWAYSSGPIRTYWQIVSTLEGVVFTVIFISSIISSKGKGKGRGEYKLLLAATILPLVSSLLGILGLAGPYDLFPTGMLMLEIIFTIVIKAFNLFDTVAIAKDIILDELHDGILVIDDYNSVSYHNDELDLIFHKINYNDINQVNDEIIEFLNNNPDGFLLSENYYTWKKEGIFDDKGVIRGVMYQITDDTKNYNYTQELIELREEADRANYAKSDFLANMSHEIRTPINAILGMNEMIIRESDNKQVHEYADNIQNAGKTLLSIINDILDLSKIESGKMEIIPSEYNLKSLLVDVENMISFRAEEKNLVLNIEADKEIPKKLYGDEKRIKQCIINFMTNAIKYTEHGSVSLKLNKKPTENKDEIVLAIAISDTGIGIKEQDLDKLFKSFSRLDLRRNRNIEGTGLGLKITRHLVELMGGTLDVKSEYGKGSCFSFEIIQKVMSDEVLGDIHIKSEEDATDKEERKKFICPKAQILCIDDNRVNVAVVKGLLKKNNVTFTSGYSGNECLEKAKDNKYDIIFLDHMMPQMDGIETLNKLKDNPEFAESKTTVIAVTANALSGAKKQYLDAGFDDYISKPIDAIELENMLLKYLPEDYIEYI